MFRHSLREELRIVRHFYNCIGLENQTSSQLKYALFDKSMLVLQETYPDCFISYCWKNSKTAVDLGTTSTAAALGWGDPRQIKKFLSDNGVTCWLDVEQMGQVKCLSMVGWIKCLSMVERVKCLFMVGQVKCLSMVGQVQCLPVVGQVKCLPMVGWVKCLPMVGWVKCLPMVGQVECQWWDRLSVCPWWDGLSVCPWWDRLCVCPWCGGLVSVHGGTG